MNSKRVKARHRIPDCELKTEDRQAREKFPRRLRPMETNATKTVARIPKQSGLPREFGSAFTLSASLLRLRVGGCRCHCPESSGSHDMFLGSRS
jgi:hypothetical protein